MTGTTSRIIQVRIVAALAEGLDGLEALDDAQALLSRERGGLFFELIAELVKVNLLQKLLDGLGAHAGAERVAAEFVDRLAILALVQKLAADQIRVAADR